MNYIAEINAFNDLQQIDPLPTGQIVLWYALMAINNKCAWAEWFTAANQTLESVTGLSKGGVAKARIALKERGLINFEIRTNRAAVYHMIPLAEGLKSSQQVVSECAASGQQVVSECAASGQQVVSECAASGQQVVSECAASSPLNKHKHKLKLKQEHKLKQKQKQKQEKKGTDVPQKEEDAFERFAEGDEYLLDALKSFEVMRRGMKKPMSEKAKELICRELVKLCGDDRLLMGRILEQSVMNSWQGVYPIKGKADGCSRRSGGFETNNPFLELLEEERAARREDSG